MTNLPYAYWLETEPPPAAVNVTAAAPAIEPEELGVGTVHTVWPMRTFYDSWLQQQKGQHDD